MHTLKSSFLTFVRYIDDFSTHLFTALTLLILHNMSKAFTAPWFTARLYGIRIAKKKKKRSSSPLIKLRNSWSCKSELIHNLTRCHQGYPHSGHLNYSTAIEPLSLCSNCLGKVQTHFHPSFIFILQHFPDTLKAFFALSYSSTFPPWSTSPLFPFVTLSTSLHVVSLLCLLRHY